MQPSATAPSTGGVSVGTISVSATRAWASLLILLLLAVLSHFDRNIMSLMVDPIKADLGISDVEFSLLQGLAFSLFFAVSSIPMGFLADRYSRHWIIFGGVVFWSFATMGCGLATTFAGLFLARFAVGVGESSLGPASNSLASDLFPPHRLALALGVLGMGAAIGTGVATAIGGFLIQWATDRGGMGSLAPWQLVFVIAGVPGIILAPLVFIVARTRETPGKGERPEVAAGYGQWLRGHAAYMTSICVGMGLHSSLAYSLIWLAAYLKRDMQLDIATVGVVVGLVSGPPAAIGFIGGGWLVDRMHGAGVRDAHYRYFIVNCVALAVLGGLAFTIVDSLIVLAAMVCVLNLLIPFTGPVMAHLQMATPPQFRGRNVSLLLLLQSAGGSALGPIGAAAASQYIYGGPQHIGLGIATMFVAMGLASAACFALGLGPARRALAENQQTLSE